MVPETSLGPSVALDAGVFRGRGSPLTQLHAHADLLVTSIIPNAHCLASSPAGGGSG